MRKFVFLYETSRLVVSCSMQRRCRHWDSTRPQMQERGYLLKEPPEARAAVSANKRDQVA
jgi:hypothetical protein